MIHLKIIRQKLAIITTGLFWQRCITFNVEKAVKISQGSVVTQTMLGGLIIYPPVANFLWCICAKNYESWLAEDKVIAEISRLAFLGPPCIYTLFPMFMPPHSAPKVHIPLLLWK